jgi:hypothetical protein
VALIALDGRPIVPGANRTISRPGTLRSCVNGFRHGELLT